MLDHSREDDNPHSPRTVFRLTDRCSAQHVLQSWFSNHQTSFPVQRFPRFGEWYTLRSDLNVTVGYSRDAQIFYWSWDLTVREEDKRGMPHIRLKDNWWQITELSHRMFKGLNMWGKKTVNLSLIPWSEHKLQPAAWRIPSAALPVRNR